MHCIPSPCFLPRPFFIAMNSRAIMSGRRLISNMSIDEFSIFTISAPANSCYLCTSVW